MKTISTIQKNIPSKLLRALMFVLLFGVYVSSNAQCTAGYTSVINPANNGEVDFINTSTGTGLYYDWDFGDGGWSSSMTPSTYTYGASGTYTVCLIIRDSINMIDSTMGCSNIFCSTINVTNSVATCNAYFYTYDTLGTLYVTNVSSGGITNYLWDFGDGTTSTLANPVAHTYAAGGNYTICLTTSNPATFCNSIYCDSVFISSCSASYTYILDTVGNGCTFSGTGSATADTYSWDFGDGTTSSLQNPYHNFATNGSYYVCLTVSSSTDITCNAAACGYVYANGLCNAYFTIQQDSANLFNYLVYNYSTSPGTLTYLWDFGDGTTSTLAFPSHTYAASSPVLLCLTINNGLLGCTDTFCDSVNPGHAAGVFTINVLNPSGVMEQTNVISSLENYPNPFSDNTNISYSIKKDATVELSILDLLGNKVSTIESGNKTSGNYSVNWNSESVAEGMYLLQLKVGNSISTKKLIINK